MRQMWDSKLTSMADSVYMGMTSLVTAMEHQDRSMFALICSFV